MSIAVTGISRAQYQALVDVVRTSGLLYDKGLTPSQVLFGVAGLLTLDSEGFVDIDKAEEHMGVTVMAIVIDALFLELRKDQP